MILQKSIFLKSTILKIFCTQKITFWLILPRKTGKFRVLRALLKSTILKKNIFLKSTILKKKFFKKHDFE